MTEEVLVVGAGPAGLALSNLLQSAGTPVRLLERRPQGYGVSRATGLHSSSLQLLAKLDLLEAAFARGRVLRGMRTYAEAAPVAFVQFAGGPGHLRNNLSVSQADLEALLLDRYRAQGGRLEMGAEVSWLAADAGGVHVAVSTGGKVVQARARHLVAADGAGSRIRRSLGVAFPGRTEPTASFVVDCQLGTDLARDEMHYFGGAHRLALVPFSAEDRFKVSGGLPSHAAPDDPAWLADHVRKCTGGQASVLGSGPVSTYVIGNRIAERFYVGGTTLIGDAAHIVPPNGGFGLNLALQDAEELAWRLTLTDGTPSAAELAAYECARRPIVEAIAAHVDSRLVGLRARTPGPSGDLLEAEPDSYASAPDGFLSPGGSLALPDGQLGLKVAGGFFVTMDSVSPSAELLAVELTPRGQRLMVAVLPGLPGQGAAARLHSPSGRRICDLTEVCALTVAQAIRTHLAGSVL